MLKRTTVLVFAAIALSCWAANPASAEKVTVAQLQQALAAAKDHPDAELAQHLSADELTERLDTASLAKLLSQAPGEKSRQALTVLADKSAVLALPASFLPNSPAPDPTAQRKILALTVNYVSQTVHQLPNFFASRTTTSFEDTPAVQRPGALTPQGMTSATAYQPLHLVGSMNVSVSYRDGQEIVETVAAKSKTPAASRTLTTSGVFGPILGTVLVDAARSNLAWSHWERAQSGMQAVFSYAVPKEKSHYKVYYDSIPDKYPRVACSTATQTFSTVVGYHGEMAIDPATGSILRLVLVADLGPSDFTVKSAIVVEYGQVEIGGISYVLPVKSISQTLSHYVLLIQGDCPGISIDQGLKTSLNDVVFDRYHEFRAETRILTDSEAQKLESQPPPTPSQPDASQPAANASSAANPAAAPPQPGTATPSAAIASSPAPPSAPAPSTPPATQSDAEITVAPAATLPDTPAAPAPPVEIAVVVYDSGHVVTGLKPSDFDLVDNGRAQSVTSAGQPAADAPSSLILVIDESHVPSSDLNKTREQLLKFLASVDPHQPVGLYTLGSSQFNVLAEPSTDQAGLISRIRNWKPAPSAPQPGTDPTTSSLKILESLANHLATLPGSKNLIWISSSAVFVDPHEKPQPAGAKPRQLDDVATRTLRAMNQARASVIAYDVSQPALSQVSGAAISADAFSQSKDTYAQIQSQQQVSLPIQWSVRELAAATGGLTLQHPSSLDKALPQILKDDSASYRLSFSPQPAGDGQFHTLSIKLPGHPTFTPRYSAGYQSTEAPLTLKQRLNRAFFDSADAGDIKVSASAAKSPTGVDLKLTIAAGDLALRQQDGRWLGDVDVFFVLRDISQHAEVEGQTLTFRLTPATYQNDLASGISFDHTVPLHLGIASLRILVLDRSTGHMGSFTLPDSALPGAP